MPSPRILILVVILALGCQPAVPVDLRLVTYNIRHGRGMDGEVNLERTAAVLRELAPDIVALQEVDNGVIRSGSQDQAAVLGELLGMHHAFGSFMDYQGGQYGMAILSRLPIVRENPVALPDGNEPRVALAVEVEASGGHRLMLVNVHFDWVASDSFRFAQAEHLAGYLDALTVPYLLLGDFNDEPASRTLGLFRSRAVEVAKPAGAGVTFPSAEPVKEIDYIFAAPAAAWDVGTAAVIAEREASDHRPVRGVVTLKPPQR
ncbi:MAG: endonuclease/exonuclease/phosphatase family protein [Gemmatimonadales bacterium]